MTFDPTDPLGRTLIPTMGLRFIERPEPASWNSDKSGLTGAVSTVRTIRVLQQRFTSAGGTELWKDVPCVTAHRENDAHG